MVILVMGIEGTGKTTVGKLLAERLYWEFADADDFHSAANKQKMKQGIALTDADRAPWLAAIQARIWRWIADKKNGVITCSALKQSYRDELLSPPAGQEGSSDQIKTLYLHGTYALIAQRLHQRQGHFAGEALLASQFATLEEPTDAISIDVSQTPEEIVDEILRRLNLNRA
jgi:gluconokinase